MLHRDLEEPTVDLHPAAANVPGPRRVVDVPGLVQRTYQLLTAGIPLTLLLDLADAGGPRSRELYAAEGADPELLRR